MAKRLIVHVGPGRTGSTSIQQMLYMYRGWLRTRVRLAKETAAVDAERALLTRPPLHYSLNHPGSLSAFDAVNGAPVTIVFGTFNYRETLRCWIELAVGGACDHWRIVCMDEELVRWMQGNGYGEQAVYYYDVLPGAPRFDFASLKRNRRMGEPMALRTRLFLHLARAGRDFIHSDGDAYWVRDPRPWLMRHGQFDLLMSQGTAFPYDQYRRHRFVLCAGFFLCRANDRTRAYFERVQALASENPLDQWGMNLVLPRDPEGRWHVNGPEWRFRLRKMGTWWRLPPGWRALLLPLLWLMARVRSIRRRGPACIVTSGEIIRGRFGNALSVGVIPMRLVTRSRVTPACVYVWHERGERGWQAARRQWAGHGEPVA